MGKKCCVPNCRSGYGAELEKVSIFPFPQTAEIRRKWVNAIPRDNWAPVTNSGVCQLHFTSDDFQQDRVDSNKRRKEWGSYCRKQVGKGGKKALRARET